ncbi:DUF6734 family protein [uncultured Kordia sp.]|uniref:DUF6734 family protein n=1 Tax=uncultured Kordia sp. TaxID=507699 RepID=UPI002613437E|nr:DUF6734 family protein [uncultured Kordia sp.]
MKIVHSFWSKPILQSSRSKNSSIAGWPHMKYFLMSWTLSCLTFKKVYHTIELITDAKGKEILVDKLQLPYDSVQVTLDALNHYPKNLWALGKIHAYALQDEPFIHVDGDVFIWERFNSKIENAELIGQHVDIDTGANYKSSIQMLREHGLTLPKVIETDLKEQPIIKASNAGIIGGNNVDFFKEFADQAFWFIDSNKQKIDVSIVGSSFAIIYEQFLYSAMAREKNIKVQHYIKENETIRMDLTDFMRKYQHHEKFVHLFAAGKTKFASCRELEMQLLTEYPEYHAKVMKLIDNYV